MKIKKFFLAFILLELLFSYAPALAQTAPTYTGPEATITQYLCTPASPGNGGSILFQCINRIYRFAIVAASILGVFFIVIAGYVYMNAGGDSESVTKAKGILESTIVALVILLVAYVLLNAINPDLIQFQNITPPNSGLTVPTSIPPTAGTNATYPNGIPVAGTSVPSKSTACTVDTSFNCNQSGTAAACAQYSSYIQQYAGMVNDSNVNAAALLQTIMYHESRCQNGLTSGQAYGLMQMVLTTANNANLKSRCGINTTIDASWFNNNPGPSICLAAAYLGTLTSSCGSDAGLLLSAYADGNCSQTAICPLAVQDMLACYNP